MLVCLPEGIPVSIPNPILFISWLVIFSFGSQAEWCRNGSALNLEDNDPLEHFDLVIINPPTKW